jgi:hypothetical protein
MGGVVLESLGFGEFLAEEDGGAAVGRRPSFAGDESSVRTERELGLEREEG